MHQTAAKEAGSLVKAENNPTQSTVFGTLCYIIITYPAHCKPYTCHVVYFPAFKDIRDYWKVGAQFESL